MIDEAMSILQYKGNKVQDPDQAFRMTLRSFSNRKKKKRTFESKNSRNHISRMQTLPITFPTGIQTFQSSQRNSPLPYISPPKIS